MLPLPTGEGRRRGAAQRKQYNPPMQLRLWIIPLLLALAALCAYGLLATFEPGDHLTYRIAYATGLALCLLGCIITWIKTAKPKP